MKLDITHMLTKSNTPFYGIVPGNAAIPLGSVVLPVTKTLKDASVMAWSTMATVMVLLTATTVMA
jgi:hypothetical protein